MMEELNEFRISAVEKDLIERLMSGDESIANQIGSQKSAPNNQIAIRLTHAESERIRDRLSSELAERGFDENYFPNDLGRTLEDLIDRFFVP